MRTCIYLLPRDCLKMTRWRQGGRAVSSGTLKATPPRRFHHYYFQNIANIAFMQHHTTPRSMQDQYQSSCKNTGFHVKNALRQTDPQTKWFSAKLWVGNFSRHARHQQHPRTARAWFCSIKTFQDCITPHNRNNFWLLRCMNFSLLSTNEGEREEKCVGIEKKKIRGLNEQLQEAMREKKGSVQQQIEICNIANPFRSSFRNEACGWSIISTQKECALMQKRSIMRSRCTVRLLPVWIRYCGRNLVFMANLSSHISASLPALIEMYEVRTIKFK